MYDYTVRDVPFIKDHAAALAIHERITPLKGGPNKGIRPIGQRRKTYQRIWLTPDGAVKITESWRNGYTNSEITYYANGVITLSAPNGSLGGGSLGFISKVLGVELNHRASRLWIHGVVALCPTRKVWNEPQERVYGSFPLIGHNLRLMRDKKYPNELVLSNVIFPMVRGINRDGAKQVRAKYRSFFLYAKGLYGLRDNSFTQAEEVDAGMPAAMTPEQVLRFATSDAVPENYQAAMYCARVSSRQWHRLYHYGNTPEIWRDRAKAALTYFDTLCLDAHPDQAYTWERKTDGKVYMGPLKLSTERF